MPACAVSAVAPDRVPFCSSASAVTLIAPSASRLPLLRRACCAVTFALPFALSVPRCSRVSTLSARLPALCRVPLLVTVCPFRVTSLPCTVPPFVSTPAFTSRWPFAASWPLVDTLSPERAMSRPAFTCP